jgi:hypothetical protein
VSGPDYIRVAFGVVLILSGLMGTEMSYGMPPHRLKPRFPVTSRVRVVVIAVGLLSLISGLAAAF